MNTVAFASSFRTTCPSVKRSESHCRLASTPGWGFLLRMMQHKCSRSRFSGVKLRNAPSMGSTRLFRYSYKYSITQSLGTQPPYGRSEPPPRHPAAMAAASFVWYFGSWSSPSSSGLERKPHSTSTARLGMWFIR